MPLPTGLDKVRDQHFDDKWFLVEWTAQLVHEEDVQAVVTPGWAISQWLHRNDDFGGVVFTGEVNIGSVDGGGVILEESGTNLDMNNLPLRECIQSYRQGTWLCMRGRRWYIASCQLNTDRISLVGLHT